MHAFWRNEGVQFFILNLLNSFRKLNLPFSDWNPKKGQQESLLLWFNISFLPTWPDATGLFWDFAAFLREVNCSLLYSNNVSYGVLLEGFRTLGSSPSCWYKQPGCPGVYIKTLTRHFCPTVDTLDRDTGRHRPSPLTVDERWRGGSQPETHAGKALFKTQPDASGSTHTTVRWLVTAKEGCIPTRPPKSELSVHFESGSRKGPFITVSLSSWGTRAVLL